jgi:hypothetical protein
MTGGDHAESKREKRSTAESKDSGATLKFQHIRVFTLQILLSTGCGVVDEGRTSRSERIDPESGLRAFVLSPRLRVKPRRDFVCLWVAYGANANPAFARVHDRRL